MQLTLLQRPPQLARLAGAAAFVAVLAGTPADLRAQDPSLPLAELLPDLILRGITLPRPTNAELSHEAHFSPIEANDLNNPAVGIVQSFNKLMMTQLSTFPLGSSAGGFTYEFDSSLGTFSRASNSFGPAFAERSTTIGRRRLSGGMTYQHTPYSRFEGQDLENGSTRFYLRHEECCTTRATGGGGGGGTGGGSGPIPQPNGTRLNPPFEGDLIEASLSLEAVTDTVAFFGIYGLTNRWDVGLVVPFVRVELDASVQATILRLATETTPLNHTFEAGNPLATEKVFQKSGDASGIGDVIVRSKYQLLPFSGGGLAAAVDVRLPTGDQQNLLGAGTSVKLFGIASGTVGRFAPHINVGYTAAEGEIETTGLLAEVTTPSSFPDEFNYAFGSEFVAHPRLTIMGDVVGRSLRDAGRLQLQGQAFPYLREGSTVVEVAEFDEFEATPGDLHLVLGTVGFKFNPAGNVLVTASFVFPMTDDGLRSKMTTVIGFDYAF
jgi:hypothetical protein